MFINCHSYFSFNYGVMSIPYLIDYAVAYDLKAIALTDINNTSGCFDFIRRAQKAGIKPVTGIEFRNGDELLYIGIARNNKGFKELNEHLTESNFTKKPLPADPPCWQHCYVIYPWQRHLTRSLHAHEYIGLRESDITSYRLYGQYDPARLVALMPVTVRRSTKDYGLHRLLSSIGHNTLLSKLGKHQHGTPADCFYHDKYVKEVYADFPQAIANAKHILDDCSLHFKETESKNKKYYTTSKAEDNKLLRRLALEGLQRRYGDTPPDDVIARFESELHTIIDLNFPAYFLINWDIVQYARSKGYFYVGRGSGANSLIAYCLYITDVDPIELSLYFERFINPSRRTPPDFDIDFSHTDRDDIRSYIFEKYKGYAALVGSYSTYERKSAIRELGKVFGLPDNEIEALQSERLDMSALDSTGRRIMEYGGLMRELPRQLSVHACGILISEEPITTYSALELMPVGYPSTQYSMLEAEDYGLHKYDILSQRGLGHIKDAVELARTNRGEEIDIHRIQDFKKDPRIREMLMKGDTIGCFYVESPAMRQLLRKLQVEDYHGLVAASSIIRPGVANSGMMREYILRYRYPARRKLAHPKLWEIMEDTYGVMVYQEDVIKVAHYYAKLTLEEADVMRRGMSGKYRSREEFQAVKEKFFSNCAEMDYPYDEVAEIWRQVESFAGYSFAKGHSASYAVESYQSLYLRAYYPIEFMTGVLNNFGGFYSTEFYLHEAKMLGAQIELPCINMSNNLAALYGTTIYMGFCLIKDLEVATVENILRVREEGEFADLNDFIKRVPVSLEQLRILIRIKAFRFTGRTAKELLWDAHLLMGKEKKSMPRRELFRVAAHSDTLPPLEYDQYEDALDEMKILSFPYTSPFKLLSKNYDKLTYAREMMAHLGRTIYMAGYYVNIKRVTTITGETMYFGSFIDEQGYLFDSVHFPRSIEQYPFTGRGCYILKGKVIEEFNVPSLDVSHMQRIPWAFGVAVPSHPDMV